MNTSTSLVLEIQHEESYENKFGIHDVPVGTEQIPSMVSVWFDPKKRGDDDKAEQLAELIVDAPVMYRKLELMLGFYAKGIKPSVGMINEIEALIQKHK